MHAYGADQLSWILHACESAVDKKSTVVQVLYTHQHSCISNCTESTSGSVQQLFGIQEKPYIHVTTDRG